MTFGTFIKTLNLGNTGEKIETPAYKGGKENIYNEQLVPNTISLLLQLVLNGCEILSETK